MDVYTAPDVLIINLKRFQYTPGSVSVYRQKIDDLVGFPTRGLDLSRYISSVGGPLYRKAPPVYDLFAVSEHSGSLRGGHYTAKSQNSIDKRWYNFNDNYVS
ncbi:unnamed protein product, partial [Choristocarpus tenellus]